MKRKILVHSLRYILLLGLILQNIFVLAQNWKPTSAAITFKIKHAFGSTAEGSFKGFLGNVYFDPLNLSTAKMQGSIEVKTLDTGSGLRDKTVKGNDYFDVEKYPKISMVSTKIEKATKENEYIAYFNLTIKKSTKTIKTPLTFIQNGTKAQIKGTFQINRLDYEVGEKSSLLGDIVTIYILLNVQQ